MLRKHGVEQDAERTVAGQLWRDEGWLFAIPIGASVNMNTDHHEWKRLLKEAGLRESRLHDARHTAATVLLGVSERAVTGIMGWSNSAMAARYQHITAAVRRDVAQPVDRLLRPASSNGE